MDCHWVLASAASKVTAARLFYVHTSIPGYLLTILGKSSPHTSSLTLKGQYGYFSLLSTHKHTPLHPGMEI